MAKFTRFDPRNKKAGQHKFRTSNGDNRKSIKKVNITETYKMKKMMKYYEEKI